MSTNPTMRAHDARIAKEARRAVVWKIAVVVLTLAVWVFATW